MRWLPALGLIVALAPRAEAQRWQDATAPCIGATAEWSNRVELGDLDGDLERLVHGESALREAVA